MFFCKSLPHQNSLALRLGMDATAKQYFATDAILSAFERLGQAFSGLKLVLLGLLAGFLFLCSPSFAQGEASDKSAEKPTFVSLAKTISPADFNAKSVLVVHYYRPDGKYTDWSLWAWQVGGQGAAHPLSKQAGSGRYVVIPVSNDAKSIGFLLRLGEWREKDVDFDRFVELTDDVTEVWLVSGDPTVYKSPEKIDLAVRATGLFLDSPDRMTLSFTAPVGENVLRGSKIVLADEDGHPNKNTESVYHVFDAKQSSHQVSGRTVYDLIIAPPVEPKDVGRLLLLVPGFPEATVFARDVLNEPAYSPLSAQLGYQYSPSATTFRTWSPVASSVTLLLFDNPTDPKAQTELPMVQKEKGLWEVTFNGDLAGRAYQYRFRSYGKDREVPDIHTFAATPDSSKSVVIDMAGHKPDGWGSVANPPRPNQTDEIIYEIHVRDFTIADESCPPEIRGTYLGLAHMGNANEHRPSSALAHVKELGATAVHLLPIHDYTAERNEYNWGYWTALFNVPESNYATDDPAEASSQAVTEIPARAALGSGRPPRDSSKATYELRSAIQELHRNGVRVILDVVYNHTSSSGASSPFDQAVPFYYFRTSPDGRLLNESGTGNAFADERPMARKYIVDSLRHWVTQYRVDGFRFDLIGMHRPETIDALTKELLPIRPDLTLYGEPWTGGGPTHFYKGVQKGRKMGVFNDNIRNAVRGDLDGNSTGFATGPGGDGGAVVRGVMGGIDDFTSEPLETINYVSAHDNRTLWDKLIFTHPGMPEHTLQSMHKLATGIVLTGQGVAFIHGGCDFARTKKGNHNSYNAGDEINAIDWHLKNRQRPVYEYIRGLVQIRRAHPAFRMPTAQLIRDNMHITRVDHQVVAFTLNGKAVGDSWSKIFVAYNGEPTDMVVDLPPGVWQVATDADVASTESLRHTEHNYRLPPYSMVICFQKD